MDPRVIADGPESGSVWIHRFRGFRVRVEVASKVFVYGVRAGDELRLVIPRQLFRDRFVRWRALIAPEVRMLKSRFSMSLANLDHMHVFMLPGDPLQFMARSADRSPEESRAPRRGSPPVPESAVFVGTYAHPFSTDLFLSDVVDVLSDLRGETAFAA